MQISNLTYRSSMSYSCNVYLLQGDRNAPQGNNTLVDVGNDPSVIDRIAGMPIGVGKRAIEQVVLTHSHSDHTGILELVRGKFKPMVYACSGSLAPDVLLQDGQKLICGDQEFQVLCTPGHSEDSICLYCPSDGTLFAGDTPVVIRADGSYEDWFVQVLERLSRKEIRTIYFGHGSSLHKNAQAVLAESLKNVMAAKTHAGRLLR